MLNWHVGKNNNIAHGKWSAEQSFLCLLEIESNFKQKMNRNGERITETEYSNCADREWRSRPYQLN